MTTTKQTTQHDCFKLRANGGFYRNMLACDGVVTKAEWEEFVNYFYSWLPDEHLVQRFVQWLESKGQKDRAKVLANWGKESRQAATEEEEKHCPMCGKKLRYSFKEHCLVCPDCD